MPAATAGVGRDGGVRARESRLGRRSRRRLVHPDRPGGGQGARARRHVRGRGRRGWHPFRRCAGPELCGAFGVGRSPGTVLVGSGPSTCQHALPAQTHLASLPGRRLDDDADDHRNYPGTRKTRGSLSHRYGSAGAINIGGSRHCSGRPAPLARRRWLFRPPRPWVSHEVSHRVPHKVVRHP